MDAIESCATDTPSPAGANAPSDIIVRTHFFVLLLTFLLTGCAQPSRGAAQDTNSNVGPDGPADDVFLPLVSAETAGIMAPNGFDVQGHRGARGLKPENTLPAFEQALDLGVSTLELDLHFTADQIVVVWHDDTILAAKCAISEPGPDAPPDPDEPTTPASALRIAALTYAQLTQYRCDRNPEPDRFPLQNSASTPLAADNYAIPTLDAVFEFAEQYSRSPQKSAAQRENAARVHFNIETKRRPGDPGAIGDDFDGVNPGAFELAILDTVEARGLADRVILQSFDHRSLWAARTVNDDLRLAALTFHDPDLTAYARRGATIWSPNYDDVTPARIEEAHSLGLSVIPWTVNEPDVMQVLIDQDVDGIITDRPDLLRRAQDE